jgi:hypothetical protein
VVRLIVHFALHFFLPAAVARATFADRWQWAWLIMVLTMVVDLDHLLVDPIYDPQRCGIGFHPLHSYPAIMVYFAMTAIPMARLVAIGLLIHMTVDGIDCLWLALE